MKVLTNTLTPNLFLQLYAAVGWEPPAKVQVVQALKNTRVSFVAYEQERPVGMLRLLGDGAMSFYIKEFAVLPKFQGKGAGSLLLQEAQEYILRQLEDNWAVSLELISTKEAIGFYEHFGFEQCPSNWEGPGMFKMLKKK